MNVADVMDEVATQLDTISGLRVVAWPAGTLMPPAAFVDYPFDYTFDEAYGRGADRLTLPVVVLVSRADDRTAKGVLGAFLNGSGPSSIKAVVEAGTYTAFDGVRVMNADIDYYQLGDVTYLAATFSLDIAGSGS